MWIEQLQQKREDIGLDYIIATTTSKFSDAAIRKAKYHGVILEQAEMLGKATVDNLPKFFFDAFFLNFELLEMNLYTTNHGKMSLPCQMYKEYNLRLMSSPYINNVSTQSHWFPYRETQFFEFDKYLFANWSRTKSYEEALSRLE